jgi:hypothetical protein
LFYLCCTKGKVDRYRDQYDDYEKFLNLVDRVRSLQKWEVTVTPNHRILTKLEKNILDLYFQINMVPDYDVYNDTLIYAYLEDIQPLLNNQHGAIQ